MVSKLAPSSSELSTAWTYITSKVRMRHATDTFANVSRITTFEAVPSAPANCGKYSTLTTQSGSSGTTSQNDKGPAGERRARRGEEGATAARASLTPPPAPRAIPSPAAEWDTRVRRPAQPRETFRACPSQVHERAYGRGTGASTSFVREARVAGRWLALYSVVVRYCTSPGLSKRARPLLRPSIRGARSR